MAEFTPNYQFEKPSNEEKYFIHKFNQNFQKVDDALKEHDDTIAANKDQEESDINDLRTEVEEYTDNAISAHNLSTDANLHPHLQEKIADALTEAKDYTYSKNQTDDRIAEHNRSSSAHQDIRDAINGIGDVADTSAANAVAIHNTDINAHEDIRSEIQNAKDYADEVFAQHNADPHAHGVSFEINAISNDDYESGTIDKTWDELNNAYDSIRNVVLKLGDLDVKITSYNNVDVEYYGNYFDGFDEHRVIIFKDENNIPTFINKSIWAVSPYVDYGKTNYMYLRT